MLYLVTVQCWYFFANVCVLEVKTSSTAMLPQSYASEQSSSISRPPSPLIRHRSDPYKYNAAASQPSFTAASYGRQGLHNQSVTTAKYNLRATSGGVGPFTTSSVTSNNQRSRSSDAVASHLASLRRTAEQSMQTFGMLLSSYCFKLFYSQPTCLHSVLSYTAASIFQLKKKPAVHIFPHSINTDVLPLLAFFCIAVSYCYACLAFCYHLQHFQSHFCSLLWSFFLVLFSHKFLLYLS